MSSLGASPPNPPHHDAGDTPGPAVAPAPPEPHSRKHNALLILGFAALVALMAWIPGLGCPTKAVTGVPCPGCGMTRAALSIARLDVGSAWRFHPLVFAIVPFGAVVTWFMAIAPLRPSDRVRRALSRGALLLAIALVVVWAARLGGALGGLPDPVEPGAAALGRVVGGG